jgi:hypothetical protein
VLFCLTLLCLSLARSLFHFVWIAALAAILLRHHPRARTLRIALVLTALLAALPALHTKLVFGKLTSSTWLGMNVANVVQQWWLPEDLQAMADRHEISQISLVKPFSPLSSYPVATTVPLAFASIPALAEPSKDSGSPNYNHYAYIAISDAYLSDAWTLLQARPATALRAIGNGFDRFMRPGAVDRHLVANRAAMQRYDAIWNRVAFGLVHPGAKKDLYLLLLVGTILGLGVGAFWATRSTKGQAELASARIITARFMMLTAAFVILIGNALERGENHRFRVYLSPFILLFLGLGASVAVDRLRRR